MTTKEEILEAIERGAFKATKEVLNVKECADYLGVSENVIYKLTSKKEIPYSKLGKHLVFSKDDINNYIIHNRVSSKDDFMQRLAERKLERMGLGHTNPLSL